MCILIGEPNCCFSPLAVYEREKKMRERRKAASDKRLSGEVENIPVDRTESRRDWRSDVGMRRRGDKFLPINRRKLSGNCCTSNFLITQYSSTFRQTLQRVFQLFLQVGAIEELESQLLREVGSQNRALKSRIRTRRITSHRAHIVNR